MPRGTGTGIKVPVVFWNHINIVEDNAVKLEQLLCFQISCIHHRGFVKYLGDCLNLQKGDFSHRIIFNKINVIIYRSRECLNQKSFVLIKKGIIWTLSSVTPKLHIVFFQPWSRIFLFQPLSKKILRNEETPMGHRRIKFRIGYLFSMPSQTREKNFALRVDYLDYQTSAYRIYVLLTSGSTT